MSFKEITIKDRALIQQFTLHQQHQNCDLAFSNLYSWRFLYHTQFAVFEAYLVLRFYVQDRLVYMMPIGTGCLTSVFDWMRQDAQQQGATLIVTGIDELMKQRMEKEMPNRFQFEDNRNHADYIYLREELATLTGKRFQPKRNHINKFTRNFPEYKYFELTSEFIPECLELEMAWKRLNMTPEEEFALESERRSLTCALNHMNELELRGGALCVDGQMAAFTFGSPINQNTFNVSVEKANIALDGAYAVINYEFARHLPNQYIYLNREEDLGLEGLRKAKLSYHPTLILQKYTATPL